MRDSIEVNGARFVYLADVSIDTTQGEVLSSFSDWWIGVGWDVRRNPQVMGTMSTLDLVSNRPQLMLEHHLTLPRMGGRLGWNVVYSQPWRLAQEEVSDNAKGWIAEPGSDWPLPVRQVILSPDSLFPEPDTLLAPLSIGNAIRIGGFGKAKSALDGILGWGCRSVCGVLRIGCCTNRGRRLSLGKRSTRPTHSKLGLGGMVGGESMQGEHSTWANGILEFGRPPNAGCLRIGCPADIGGSTFRWPFRPHEGDMDFRRTFGHGPFH